MKFVITVIVAILIQFSYSGCATSNGSTFSNGKRADAPLIVKSRIPLLPAVRGISFDFDFTENQRLWNTVDWGQKDPQFFSFSDDLGKSWRAVEVPESFGTRSTIKFISQENGWAVSSMNIVRTTDGGKSWRKIPLPKDSEINEIKGITFNDVEQGFLAGSTSLRERGSGEETPGMEILCTNDGGENWSVCFKTNEYDLIQKIISTESVVIGLLWETGILRSNDGGHIWERKNLDFKIRDVAINSDGRIWSLGDDSLLRYSNDLGDSWQTAPIVNISQKIRWNSLVFNNNGVGIVVSDQGKIGLTTDNGYTWNIHSDIIFSESLWTVRAQGSYIAILGERNLYILELNTKK